jgi:hypothetical protein
MTKPEVNDRCYPKHIKGSHHQEVTFGLLLGTVGREDLGALEVLW